ncbi:hypothetical protein ACEWX3_07725 [Mycobacterium sp. G7A2]|uniref:hypothetical protein n=1 Tax=Mycobacterium sp. G7A2 TaxID=3317307 RepID=UPI0035A81842
MSETATTKTAAKTPAKKMAAPQGVKFVYTATGRDGREARRTSDKVFTHAVDLADPDATRESDRKGKIARFFPNKDRAEAWAETQRADGYDAKVVTARPAN